MANMVPGSATAVFGSYKKRQLWLRIVIGLAAIVVFFTTYALILPAITMEGNLVCELEEHTHTDACYEAVYVEDAATLICSQEHEHTAECYETSGHYEEQLVCEIPEHIHTADCYDAPASGGIKYTCNMDEHTHGDGCYNEDGELVCTMPEHTHTDSCIEKRSLKSMLAAVKLLGASNDTVEKIYWKPITDTSELTTDGVYMIVTANGGVALHGSNAATSTKANMQEAAEKPGYYNSQLDNNYWWKVSANGSPNKIKNIGTDQYIYLNDSKYGIYDESVNYATAVYYQYNRSGYWTMWSNWGSTYYLTYNNGFSTTTSSNSTSNRFLIYKQYIEEVPVEPTPDDPGDGGGGGGVSVIVKPTYPAYVQVSGPKTGETVCEGIMGNYWSDPSTSQLESKFNGVSADDGKVLTDKSVIYGHDDYDAFPSYDPNTFGVTLSALAQTYAISEEVQAPIDVVFVVDTSGSMIDAQYNGTNAATETVKALNQAMKMVMDANSKNRVGVVCFSNYSHKILDLGRYSATNDKYFPDSYSNYDSNEDVFTPSSSIRRTDGGTLYKGEFKAGWYGTYTQAGIAEGAKELINATDKLVNVDVTINADDGRTITKTVAMHRRPVIILLSDGAPTFCNENYSTVLEHNSTIHGSGSDGFLQDADGLYRPVNNWGAYSGSGSYQVKSSYDGKYPPNYNASYYRVNNPKGVMGYYTILSANSYKEQVAKSYGTDAYFYTIGLGMNEGSKDSVGRSISSDIYKTAVLNPTAANISKLSTTSGRTNCVQTDTGERDISPFTLETSTMLAQLLNNTATPANNQWIKSESGKNYAYVELLTSQWATEFGSPNATTPKVPIISNPYVNGYQYTNGASFTNQPTAQELAAIYEKAISAAGDAYVYGFMMKNGSALTVSDTIGKGMEIVRDSDGNTVAPVLNYGGKNYSSTSHETVDGKTIYHYTGTHTATDGSGRTVDISMITAVVETVDGQQKVSLKIPEDAVPLYSPCVDVNGKAVFYYEDLPARLIYQVGLTDESKEAVAALKDTDGKLTFYTNEWNSDTNYASAEFEPMKKNPYYKDDDYDKDPLRKTENTTDTKSNAWKYESACDEDYVKVELGNNGKLVFDATKEVVVDVGLDKVDENGNPVTTDTARFELYEDEALTSLVGTYETNENGKLTIKNLVLGKTYYLKEIKAPAGYALLSEAKAFTVDKNGSPAIDGSDYFLSVKNGRLQFKNTEPTSFSVLKKWNGGTEDFVEVELLANGETTGRYATLNADNSWYHMWNDLPKYSADGSEIDYSIREIAVDGYNADIHCWTGKGDPYGQTGSEGWEQKSSFENGKTYILTHKNKGYDVAIGINNEENSPWMYDIDLSDLSNVPDNLKWKASVSGSNITLTNVGTGQKLVLNSSNKLAVGGSNNHADTWKYDTSNKRLYTTYTYRSGWSSRTDTYYYNSNSESGVTTNANSATPITLYAYYSNVVEDDVKTGATHYIIKNTKETVTGDLSLTFKKVNSEDGTLVNGAKLSLYRETGPIEGAVIIPGTTDRYGISVKDWTSSGNGETISDLLYGDYYLVETEAPYGYEGLEEPIVFSVGSENGVRTATIVHHPTESGTFTELSIPNTPIPAYELPETGGIGTPIIYALGALLIAGALMYGSFLRRKSERRAK